MNFHVLTLFPEMITGGMNTSITGRAISRGLIRLDTVNIRDYAEQERKGRVDDYPYGGGAGMVMQAQPVYACHQEVCRQIARRRGAQTLEAEGAQEMVRRVRTVYLTPQGELFTQRRALELSREEDLILLCGHYEGIDERVLEEVCTDQLSIGDYVLTGGELAAMVVMDAVSRMVPGVLSNAASGREESFSEGLLEYPQYSRPEVWRGKAVPPVLLSGHHANVDRWRREQSLARTLKRRPELLESSPLTPQDRKYLQMLLAKNEET